MYGSETRVLWKTREDLSEGFPKELFSIVGFLDMRYATSTILIIIKPF